MGSNQSRRSVHIAWFAVEPQTSVRTGFSRTLGGVYALCLLNALIKVQVNVASRYFLADAEQVFVCYCHCFIPRCSECLRNRWLTRSTLFILASLTTHSSQVKLSWTDNGVEWLTPLVSRLAIVVCAPPRRRPVGNAKVRDNP